MKNKFGRLISAVISTLILAGCGAAENASTENTSADNTAESTAVTEMQTSEISAEENTAVTDEEQPEDVTDAPEEEDKPYNDDEEAVVGDEVLTDSTLLKLFRSTYNKKSKLSADGVTVSWESQPGRTYLVSAGDMAYYVEGEGELLISDLERNIPYEVTVMDITGSEDETGPVVFEDNIFMLEMIGCGGMKVSYHDSERTIVSWSAPAGCEFTVVYLDGEYFKTVKAGQVTVEGLCPWSEHSIKTVPMKSGEEGGFVYGCSTEFVFLVEDDDCAATAERAELTDSLEYKGSVIYTEKSSYPVLTLSDEAVSKKLNDAIGKYAAISYNKKDEQALADDAAASGLTFSAAVENRIDLVRNTDKLITVSVVRTRTTAGSTTASVSCRYFSFDPSTGEAVPFDTVFDRALFTDRFDEIVEKVFTGYEPTESDTAALEATLKKDADSKQFNDGMDWLDRHWYISDGKLFIVFDASQVGTLSEGVKRISFGLDEIKDYIADKAFTK